MPSISVQPIKEMLIVLPHATCETPDKNVKCKYLISVNMSAVSANVIICIFYNWMPSRLTVSFHHNAVFLVTDSRSV